MRLSIWIKCLKSPLGLSLASQELTDERVMIIWAVCSPSCSAPQRSGVLVARFRREAFSSPQSADGTLYGMLAYSVVIPAYNEEKSIARAVRETRRVFRLYRKPFEIIVVDDGSDDATRKAVLGIKEKIPELVLVRHRANLGKGAAIRTGSLAARGRHVLFLDADLATHPSEFTRFRPHLADHDILIGSRRVAGAQIGVRQPIHRHWLGRAFNLAVRHYLKLPYRDTQCGFKVLSRSVIPLLRLQVSRGWAFDVELLKRAQARGLRVKEFPVSWNHGRETRVRLGHAWGILKELERIKRVA
jgi:glycosyltransferase involved in cell wall biosynthesis